MNDNTASPRKPPTVYVGQPLPKLLKRVGQDIEAGKIDGGRIQTGTDLAGLSFVRVTPK
jgi:hypothetical protein